MLAASTLLLVATLAGYALLCAASPFGPCRTCRGLGYKHVLDCKGRPKRAKPCRRCKGHGKRLRLGRRLSNHSRAVHQAGTR
ncbi:hypothetical protein ACF06X_03580 [Streptomyces sp. NPDC015346]|uniref:hypothetical protein n=1 Tax=Streptomyces sp. NPDC015346 TaxID=3364954 RepID=UPI0036F920AB